MQVREVYFYRESRFIKENELEVLLDNGDGTATWFLKALLENYKFDPATDKASFRHTNLAAGRTVKLV